MPVTIAKNPIWTWRIGESQIRFTIMENGKGEYMCAISDGEGDYIMLGAEKLALMAELLSMTANGSKIFFTSQQTSFGQCSANLISEKGSEIQ